MKKIKNKQRNRYSCRCLAVFAVPVLFISEVLAGFAGELPILVKDPHYTEIGFFDMHVCNWPDRPRFFKILFSTEKFNDIEKMEAFAPSGTSIAILDKQRFMPIKRKNKPDKRVFMVNIDVPDHVTTGWYTMKVKTTNGKTYEARDYVALTRIERAIELDPAADKVVDLPVTLNWKKVPGAAYYRVYVRDVWTDEMVYESKLITENALEMPRDKLEPGGYYSWAVHARDVNEHILFGDFHMGSMSEKAFFNVAD